ncbi:hypothetical protein OPIT5_26990 [Opitutaceae bacterium TAV5]|nr:hypothetical protein OPIT5_26990 [Opitutaceae bacterium TAV5]
MNTPLTEFQRSFKSARKAADKGESVIIEADNQRYVETLGEQRKSFTGMRGVFGAAKLTKKKGTHREQIRRRLAKKHRG